MKKKIFLIGIIASIIAILYPPTNYNGYNLSFMPLLTIQNRSISWDYLINELLVIWVIAVGVSFLVKDEKKSNKKSFNLAIPTAHSMYFDGWFRIFDYKGVSSRLQYFVFILSFLALCGCEIFLESICHFVIPRGVIGFFCFWFILGYFSISIRRLNDSGHSVLWIIFSGILLTLVLLMLPTKKISTEGDEK